MVREIAPAIENEQPAEGQRDVEGGVPDVESVHRARETEHRALQRRLDVDPEPLLGGDDPLGVPVRPRTAITAQHQRSNEQIQPVNDEREGYLTPG